MKEIRCRALVVGGGLAGLLVAHWSGGDIVLVTRGLGATALSSSTFRQAPHHSGEFAELAEECGVSYAMGKVATGTCDIVEAFAPDWCRLENDAPFFVGLSGLPSAVRELRATLNVDWGVPFPTPARAAARVERVPALLEKIAKNLACLPDGELLLPPVLGVTPRTRNAIERESGHHLMELACPQGALGHRLLYALRQKLLEKKGVTLLEETKAVSLKSGPPHRVNLSLGKLGRRTVDIVADAVVLCTGGPLTALVQEGDELMEPLTGRRCADISQPPPEDLLLPQPAFEATLPADDGYRIDGLDGVFACGALGAGFGLAECVDSAWEVSRRL